MRNTSKFLKTLAAASALVLCLGVSACGESSSDSSKSSDSSTSSDSSISMNQIAGVTATGEPGEKPEIAFKAPMTVEDNSYVVLQEGNGDQIEDGDRLCMQAIALNAQDGTEIASSWEDNTPDCSVLVSSDSLNSDYYNIFKSLKLNATVAFGSNDTSSSTGVSYIMAYTLVSKSKDYTQATGDEVTDIPADLPKVTRAKNGKPSIDMNGYKGSDTLIAQPLIKGKGAAVTEKDSVVVKYSGWLLDGTQFDSSWDRGSTFTADAYSGGNSTVIEGWQQGMVGQTVGSQVLMVIPPDLGYGDTEQGSIPANSTLVFVVDILAAYQTDFS